MYVVQYGGEPEFTAKAIANAGAVVVTLGPGENGPSRGPLDCARALSIVTAATLARVGTFVLLSDFKEGAGGALGGLGTRLCGQVSGTACLTATRTEATWWWRQRGRSRQGR